DDVTGRGPSRADKARGFPRQLDCLATQSAVQSIPAKQWRQALGWNQPAYTTKGFQNGSDGKAEGLLYERRGVDHQRLTFAQEQEPEGVIQVGIGDQHGLDRGPAAGV